MAPTSDLRSYELSVWLIVLAAALLALTLLAGGCAASSALHRGQQAERRKDFDFAVVEYTKALHMRPDDTNVRLALDRAKLRASQDHYNRGRRFSATGKFDQALVEFEDCVPVELSVDAFRAELRTPGAMTGLDAAYLALDHAGLL